jgi:acetyltransferase-like isoleucine patch superfamily enzyme
MLIVYGMSYKKIIKKALFYFKPNKKNKFEIKNYSLFHNVDFNNSTIGDYSYIARNSIVHNCDLGKFCSIGPNVIIGYGDHPTNFVSTSPVFYSKTVNFSLKIEENYYDGHERVCIGNDIWIGAGAFIKNGVNIGNGAIIGAGAVVLKDVEPYSINVGVPSKIIKYRFNDIIIKKLQKLKWWDYPEAIIQKKINLFSNEKDIEEFINKFSKQL